MTPERAWRTAAWVTGAATVVRLVLAARLGLTSDEAYHWLWAMRLDWAYHEHPPLLAWAIAGAVEVLGDTRVAVRLPSIAGAVLLSWALYRIAADRWKDPVAGARAACLATVTPFVLGAGFYASTDMLFVGCFTAAVWALSGEGRAGDAVRFGLFAGLAMLAKWIGVLLLPGAVLAVALSDRRARLKTPAFWGGLALALAIFSPVLLWNAARGWPNIAIRVGHQVGGQSFPGQYVLELVGVSLLVWTPWLLVAAVRSVPALARRWRAQRSLADAAVLFVPGLVLLAYVALSFRQRIAVQWPAAGVVALFLPLALAGAGRARALRRGGVAAAAVSLAVLAVAAGAALLPDEVAYPLRREQVSTRNLKRELLGTDDLGRRVREELDRARAGGARAVFLLGDDTGLVSQAQFEAGAGDVVSMVRVPPRRSGGEFRWWMEEDEPGVRGADAVYVKADRTPKGSKPPPPLDAQRERALDDVRDEFEAVEAAPDLVVTSRGRELRRFFVVRCRGYRGGYPEERGSGAEAGR